MSSALVQCPRVFVSFQMQLSLRRRCLSVLDPIDIDNLGMVQQPNCLAATSGFLARSV